MLKNQTFEEVWDLIAPITIGSGIGVILICFFIFVLVKMDAAVPPLVRCASQMTQIIKNHKDMEATIQCQDKTALIIMQLNKKNEMPPLMP